MSAVYDHTLWVVEQDTINCTGYAEVRCTRTSTSSGIQLTVEALGSHPSFGRGSSFGTSVESPTWGRIMEVVFYQNASGRLVRRDVTGSSSYINDDLLIALI